MASTTLWITLDSTYLLEVVADLKLALLVGDVGLDFSVRVVNDGQEHIEQHEEHEEYICDEEDWTKDAIGSLQGMEVEITQDNTEQCKATRKNKTVHSNSKIRSKCQKIKTKCKASMCNAFAWLSKITRVVYTQGL